MKLSDMLEYKMSYPGSEEQKKIAKFFDNLDHLITLHQCKCFHIQNVLKFIRVKIITVEKEKSDA